MTNYSKRLKLLERRVIESIDPEPAIVQIINGERTDDQQAEYDNAIAKGMFVVSIGVKDCTRKVDNSNNENI